MKAVKIAVIIMSLLLVVGLGLVVTTLLSRMNQQPKQIAPYAVDQHTNTRLSLSLSPSEKITKTHLSDQYLCVKVENAQDPTQNRYILHSLQHQTQSVIYLYQ